MQAMICPKPYTAAILTNLGKRLSCSTFHSHKATFQAYLCSFILSFFLNIRWSYGIVMWEIATLGKIPTFTYFIPCVAFSGTERCVFAPFSSCFIPSFALPNHQNLSVPSGYLGSVQLNKGTIKQENGQYSVFTLNLIHQLSCNPGQDG